MEMHKESEGLDNS